MTNVLNRIPVRPLPVPTTLSRWTRLTIFLFGGRSACRYCGRRYVPCHADARSMVWPVAADGRACPDGHEGYVDRPAAFGGIVRERFDYVADPPET